MVCIGKKNNVHRDWYFLWPQDLIGVLEQVPTGRGTPAQGKAAAVTGRESH